MLPNPRF